MARKSRRSPLIVIVIALLVLVAIGWIWRHGLHRAEPPAPATPAKAPASNGPMVATADRIDPADEGKMITIKGRLAVHEAARDTQLDVSADAVMLLRYTDMLQWRERCSGDACTYQKVWSPQPIDSSRFREKEGHKNPPRLPLTIARYASRDVRLGAFHVDAYTLGNYRSPAGLKVQPLPYRVSSAQLPTNLKISFRDNGGTLYAGKDPAHPEIGDMRVIYRVIPAVDVVLTGIQHGDQLLLRGASAVGPIKRESAP